MALIADMGLTLMNSALRRSPDRFTFISESGRSIPDLALILQGRHCSLSVHAPPANTPHQLLLITMPDELTPPAHDPTRWNWSRKAFAREPENARCRAALEPVMEELVAAWAALGR
ncbi:hypothetical protein B5P43_36895, partial [Bacillus sp. SRB_336]